MTEIEIYDTGQPPDPETGRPPMKARVKRHHDSRGKSRTVEKAAATTITEDNSELAYYGGELEEVEATAARPPGLWDRAKAALRILAAIMIPAAAGWIVYRIRKRKKI